MIADDTDTTKTNTKTDVKTLWSETVLEMLYEVLRKNKSDAALGTALKDVLEKGFKREYIVEKVEKKVNPQAAARIKQLFSKR